MTISPFHMAAQDYFTAGYQPVPIPFMQKEWPPKGFTGHDHKRVTEAHLTTWLSVPEQQNLANVMADGQVVIDVDGELGWTEIERLEKQYGPLPETFSVERGDRTRRHMYFRCRKAVSWPDTIPKIDFIQGHHRYAMLPPSVHPSKKRYCWYDLKGRERRNWFPSPEDWVELPDDWHGLTEDYENRHKVAVDVDLMQWLADNDATGKPCDQMKKTVRKHVDRIRRGDLEGFHGSVRDAVWAVLGDMHSGHDGGKKALRHLKAKAFEYTTRRDDKTLEGEWRRALTRGIKKWASEGERLNHCWCGSDNPKDRSGRNFKYRRAGDTEVQAIDWLLKDRIPLGEITLLVGREGSGKGMLACHWAAQISTGRMEGHFKGNPQKVAIVAREDSWAKTIAPRLIAAGANMDNILNLEVWEDGAQSALTFPKDLPNLGREISNAGVRLLILDPLLSAIAGEVDTHKSTDVRSVLERFRYELEKTNTAALGIMHFNKTTGTDMLTKISGSRAFTEVARAAIGVAMDDESGLRVMSQPRNNLGLTNLPNWAFDVDSVDLPARGGRTSNTGKLHWVDLDYARTAEDALEKRVTPERGSGVPALCLGVVEAQGEPVSPKEVAEAIDRPLNTVQQAMRRLASAGKLEKTEYGLYSISAA